MFSSLTPQRAAAKDKTYLLADAKGLYLRVTPAGTKSWIVRYWIQGKESQLKIGEFPAVSLSDARRIRDEIKSRVKSGLPAVDKSGVSFRQCADEWYRIAVAARRSTGRPYAPRYLETITGRLEKYIFPAIGARPIREISRQEIADFLTALIERGRVEMARRVGTITQTVFNFALERGIIERDVCHGILRLLPQAERKSFTSVQDPDGLARLMAGIYTIESPITRAALLMCAYCFTRVGETLATKWNEIDMNNALWTIPAEHTKRRRELIVPLPQQMTKVLTSLQNFERITVYHCQDISNRFVFPARRPRIRDSNSITEAAMLKALKVLTWKSACSGDAVIPASTVHGFRHTASTVLHDNGFNSLWIEKQLAHLDPNKIRGIYNSAEYLPQRREMLQWYADYLDALRDGKPAPEKPL